MKRPTAPPRPSRSRSVQYHLRTLFLFTRSDVKTVIVPQSIFATAFALYPAASTCTRAHAVAARLPLMLAWLWLHLLVENLANQRLPGSVVEDRANKPWRPIPAGRTTPAAAQRLLRVAVPAAAALSVVAGAGLAPCTALLALVWLYNDLDAAGAGALQRNAVNAAGLSCFGWGAVDVLLGADSSADTSASSSHLRACWLLLMAAVIATTVHAQDFPDIDGDAARGRRTLPLVLGQRASRGSLAVLVVLWTVVCPAFWGVRTLAPLATAVGAAVLGPLALVAALMAALTLRGGSDALVWRLWCAWVTLLYLLPALAARLGM